MVACELKKYFLFFKWPSLQQITPRNTLCVNAPLERKENEIENFNYKLLYSLIRQSVKY